MAWSLTPGESRARLMHESSFTLVERILSHYRNAMERDKSHQAGGSVDGKILDDGTQVTRFMHYHHRNGPWENYQIHGVIISPATDTYELVIQNPVVMTFIYPDSKQLSYEITEFKLRIQDDRRTDEDFELLSYTMTYKSPTAGVVNTRTVEPLRYQFNAINILSSAKPLSGKIEIINHNKKATVTVLPTPEQYSYQWVQVDADGRTSREQLRYQDQMHFRQLPPGL